MTACGAGIDNHTDNSDYDSHYKIVCISNVQYAITSLTIIGDSWGTTGITVLYNTAGRPLKCQENKS